MEEKKSQVRREGVLSKLSNTSEFREEKNRQAVKQRADSQICYNVTDMTGLRYIL